jgi:general secretion pathway protein A
MYNNHFGFASSPFSVTPDPRFNYTNNVYREALATLRYGVEARKGFIVITGEAGTGKTTLLRKLIQGFGTNIHTGFIYHTQLTFKELLRVVLTDLQVDYPTDDRLSMLTALNDYLIKQLERGDVVTLLVDEAQDLSPETLEELRLLSNLETDRDKLLQIVLMGQPELERKLDRPELRQLKQRVALHCRLESLQPEETGPYVASRLETVNYTGAELFDEKGLQKIAHYSKGIPRLINHICDNALLITFAASQKKVDAQTIDEVARDLRLGSRSSADSPVLQEGVGGDVHGDYRSVHAQTFAAPVSWEPRSASQNFGLTELCQTQITAAKGHRVAATRKLRVATALIGLLIALIFVSQFGTLKGYIYDAAAMMWHDGKEGVAAENTGHRAAGHLTDAPVPDSSKSYLLDEDFVSPRAPVTEITETRPFSQRQSRPGSESAAARVSTGDYLRPERSRFGLTAPGESKPAELNPATPAKAKKQSRPQNFEVAGDSFVRDKPTSDAEIIATLPAGTRIEVVQRVGDYFQIRGVGMEPIRGFVHREDAFFK